MVGVIGKALTITAVAAEKAMWEAAYIFAAGELLNYYKFIRSSEGNVFNHLGKIVSFAAPFVAAVFLKDNSFNPALTLGMIPAWGAGKGVEKLGDAVETGKIEKDYLTSGRNAMLENINRQYRELIKIQSVLKEESTVTHYLHTKELIEAHRVTEKARDFKKGVFELRTSQSTLFDAD